MVHGRCIGEGGGVESCLWVYLLAFRRLRMRGGADTIPFLVDVMILLLCLNLNMSATDRKES